MLSAYPTPSLHACVPLPHPHKQVRLLELDPVYSHDPNTASELHGRLRVVHLREQQEYSALSYVWSQEDPGTSQRNNRLVIHCDEHQHEARIGPNCWSALWHLIKARGALTIWVDSICIDQRNSEEKAHQIPLMQEIFESAHTTYHWLGEAATGTDKAINYLSTNVLLVGSGTVGDIVKAGLTLFLRRHTFRAHPHRSALDNIFKRRWIKRLWTLQEAVLSPNSIVVCGESSIPWGHLVCALESIHYLRTQTSGLGFKNSYTQWINLARVSRWFADRNAGCSRRQHPLSQSSHRLNALQRKVQRHLRCLTWALRVYLGLCLVFFCLCYAALIYILNFQKANLVLVGFSIAAFYTYIMLLGNRGRLADRELCLSTSLYMESHSIIQELRTRKATDPKDIYFGTLGILGGDSSATPGSLSILYTRLCANLIRRTESLDILLFANADTERKFPSWVIDWSLKTPHNWNKPLYWIPTSSPDQTGHARQDSVLMHSDFWMRLHSFYKIYAPRRRLRAQFFVPIAFLKDRCVRRYQGATPGSNPFWEFRNQGEHLCVHGLVLTEIISCLAPVPTRPSATESQSALRVLSALRELMHFQYVDLVDLLNAIFETTAPQSEFCMFTSLVFGALLDMTETDRLKTVDRSNKLIDVLTENMDSAQLLWTWWRRLLLSAANNQGTVWAENLVAEDKSLKDRLDAFMKSLGTGGLNVVRCQRTELCTGGLGFAAAAIQEGDSVALVSGVSYPLVLRSCGQQHFKVIGPIFLPLIMDGELMEVVGPESMGEIILV